MQAEIAHADELTADLRQYYGVRRSDLPPHEAATLAAQLPKSSRVMISANPDLAWSQTEWFLWRIEYLMRVLVWQRTKDGQAGRNQPQPLMTPSEAAQAVEARSPETRRFVDEILGISQGGES